MKSIVFFVLSLFLLSASAFALDVTNEDGQAQTYFSISESIAKVETSQNAGIFEVLYTLNSIDYTDNFSLTSCSSNYCGEVDLTDLIQENNGTFTGATEFTIKSGSEQKTVYLDFQKPTFSLDDHTVNTADKELDLTFSFDDNIGVDTVDIYKKEGSDALFVVSLKNQNSYTYELETSGDLTLEFRVSDEAGNEEIEEEDFTIPDLFAPTIEEYFIEYKNSGYSLTLTAKDDEALSEYKVKKSNIELSEPLSGLEQTKSILLPFTSGTVTLEVLDKADNKVSKELSLENTFSVSSTPSYTGSETFSFTSDADKCVLTKIDSTSKSTAFSKSSDKFTTNLDLNEDDTYTVDFYCEKNNFRKHFSRSFTYDNTKPEDTKLSIAKNSDGELELEWEESKDDETDVTYILYRDGKKEYSGAKLSYTDDEVEYPKEYEYYVRVEDEAGNYADSNKVSEVPNKVSVSFLSGMEREQSVESSSFTLDFVTDEQTTVTYSVINNGETIKQDSFVTSSRNVDVDVPLKDGTNKISLLLEDDFGNKVERDFLITKEVEVTASEPSEPAVEENTAVIEQAATQEEVPEETTPTDYSNLIWFILFIIVLLVFVWFFIVKESSLREKLSDSRKRRAYSGFSKKRKDDMILGRSLNKAKKERIKRQQERAKEEARKEKKKEVSAYHKKKLDEISRKSEVHFPLLSRKKAEKRVNRIRKRNKYSSFIQKERDLGTKKDPEDEKGFASYLGKVKSGSHWDTTAAYRAPKEVPKEEKPQEEVPKPAPEKKAPEKAPEPAQEKPQKKEKKEKVSLDDYLNKRTKKKRSYFAERRVARDEKRFR